METRNLLYNVEKHFIVYSVLRESAILGESILNSSAYSQGIVIKGNDGININTKNKFISSELLCYNAYFSSNYRHIHQLIGYTIKNDKIAQKEFEKRINILGEVEDKQNLFGNVQYTELKKYDKLTLTPEEIPSSNRLGGNNPVLIKIRAYQNYIKKDYNKALTLYKEFLKYSPDDYDSLLNLTEIYNIQKDYRNM